MSVRTLLVRVAVVTALGMATGTALADNAASYDTQRIVRYAKNECRAATGPCRTIKSQPIWLKAGTSRIVSVRCPATYPHVVGWDSRQREHISLRLLPTMPGQQPGASTAAVVGRFDAIQLAIANHADSGGDATIFLGCSTKPFKGGGFAMSRGAMPSRNLRAAIR